MKIFIDKDEWWPVLSLDRERTYSGEKEAEITDEEFENYQRMMKEFNQWQSRLWELYGRELP